MVQSNTRILEASRSQTNGSPMLIRVDFNLSKEAIEKQLWAVDWDMHFDLDMHEGGDINVFQDIMQICISGDNGMVEFISADILDI